MNCTFVKIYMFIYSFLWIIEVPVFNSNNIDEYIQFIVDIVVAFLSNVNKNPYFSKKKKKEKKNDNTISEDFFVFKTIVG